MFRDDTTNTLMITPQEQSPTLATAIGLDTGLYLKREDLHPYGSHKGRSIPLMIKYYLGLCHTNFCISSSGNAALAALFTIQELNKQHPDNPCHLRIFVGRLINKEKLQRLQKEIKDNNITIEQVEMPKQKAFQLDKEGVCKNLRQSIDDTALTGYQTLANELAKIPNLSAIFIPTSSGTTAQGLYHGFKKIGINPQIHIVQTPKCHPLVDDSPTGSSMATAIVDTIGYRKTAVQQAMQASKGKGWIATDEDIILAQDMLKEHENLEVSANSALALAGLQLALKQGWQFTGPVACLITGK